MDDVILLSRVQFALTIMFHYLFPPLSIGIAVVLVYLEGMFLRTGEVIYASAARFWTRLFALTFAMGVATGIVMEFQFGTNWAVYSRFVGDVFGSALAAEGIFAFFLESGFLAVLVFGWDRVGPRFHFFSALMVALGSMFSAIWIVVANSWQQTPAGHHVVPFLRKAADGTLLGGQQRMRAEITDFWAMVFNPSSVPSVIHVWIGAFLAGAFFIMSISAYYILRGRHVDFARRSFTGALILGLLSSVGALVTGHTQAVTVYRHQPAKLAAFEGVFETGPADLSLLGLPDEQERTVLANFAVPGGLSLLVHGDLDTPVVGLDRFAREDWPPVVLSFASYHLMIVLGMLFIALTGLAAFLRWRNSLFQRRWLMWVFVFAVAGPFLSNEAGWAAAEVGRQPWAVHPPVQWTEDGLDVVVGPQGVVQYDDPVGLRTSAAVSEALRPGQVTRSIVMFSLVYLLLLVLWLFLLDLKIRQGPEPVHELLKRTPLKGVMQAASARVRHEESMTEDKERQQEDDHEDARVEPGRKTEEPEG